MGLCGLLPNWFYEVNWLQKWFGNKTHLSCIYLVNVHDKYFVVHILHVSCCRLIQLVELYTNWYMMWCLKKDKFCKEHIFLANASFLKRSVRHPFFSRSGRCLSVWSSSIIQQTCSTWNLFVHLHVFVRTLIFTIVCAIVLAIACRSYKWSFWSVQGSNSWPCSTIFSEGPGADSLTLQHDLFVGPVFNSQTQLPVSGP